MHTHTCTRAPHLLADAARATALNLVFVPKHRHARRASAVVEQRPPVAAVREHGHQCGLAAVHAAGHCRVCMCACVHVCMCACVICTCVSTSAQQRLPTQRSPAARPYPRQQASKPGACCVRRRTCHAAVRWLHALLHVRLDVHERRRAAKAARHVLHQARCGLVCGGVLRVCVTGGCMGARVQGCVGWCVLGQAAVDAGAVQCILRMARPRSPLHSPHQPPHTGKHTRMRVRAPRRAPAGRPPCA
jgi:hypothetical protein